MSNLTLAIPGFATFFATCLLGSFLYFTPPSSSWYALLPCALAALSFLIVTRQLNWRCAVAQLAAAATVTIGVIFLIWPAGNDPASADDAGLTTVKLDIPNALTNVVKPAPHSLQAIPGLKISVFAAGLQAPRMLAFSSDGDLYVSLPHAGQVGVLPDRNGDGVADRLVVFADGLKRPHGLAFDGRDLVVAEKARLIRLPDKNGDLRADRIEIISTDLPSGSGHWTRSVIVGSEGDFFVAAGSSCNVCIEKDPRRAAILRIPYSGGPANIYARGLRNSVGLALHPETGELWASDNGRDRLGDDLPPEEINRIVADGDYGWPFCYGQRIPDPNFGNNERCRQTLPPEVDMQAHSAPLGIAFGRGLDFPGAYRDMLFVAFHGSWNRTVPTGYKLVGIPFSNGRPSGPPQDIVRGWLQGRTAWGRPVGPAVGPDGALYLSDDRAGFIYRITMRTGADKVQGGARQELTH